MTPSEKKADILEQLQAADLIVTTKAVLDKIGQVEGCEVSKVTFNEAMVCGYRVKFFDDAITANEKARELSDGQNVMLLTESDVEFDE